MQGEFPSFFDAGVRANALSQLMMRDDQEDNKP
jgi:hypothetical protein